MNPSEDATHPKQGFCIEEFSPSNLADVVDLILPIQQQEFGISIGKQDQPDLLDIPKFYREPGGNFWVARVDGRVVGTIGLLAIGNQQAALRKMFVAKEFRGREKKVAQALLETLLNWAQARGLQEIFLGTTDKFLAAHRFYEKNGFIRVEPEQLPPAFPRMAVDSVFYARALKKCL